jgi:succinate dehydrogenase hydrophobic anchor subunit
MARHRFVTRHGRTIEDDTFRETLAPTAPVYREVVREHVPTRRAGLLEMLVGWVAGLVMILLAIRFVFSLLAVNQANGFSNFTYNVTSGFVSPFNGLFSSNPSSGLGYFDLPAVAAVLVVALVAWAVVAILRSTRRAE